LGFPLSSSQPASAEKDGGEKLFLLNECGGKRRIREIEKLKNELKVCIVDVVAVV
jgi:hypothetical protein